MLLCRLQQFTGGTVRLCKHGRTALVQFFVIRKVRLHKCRKQLVFHQYPAEKTVWEVRIHCAIKCLYKQEKLPPFAWIGFLLKNDSVFSSMLRDQYKRLKSCFSKTGEKHVDVDSMSAVDAFGTSTVYGLRSIGICKNMHGSALYTFNSAEKSSVDCRKSKNHPPCIPRNDFL